MGFEFPEVVKCSERVPSLEGRLNTAKISDLGSTIFTQPNNNEENLDVSECFMLRECFPRRRKNRVNSFLIRLLH